MAQYPIRLDLDKIGANAKRQPDNRPAKPITQNDLNRHARIQGEESRSEGRTAKKMAKGGSASSRADGIAKRGKTKGMEPKMAGGGKCYAKGGSIDGIAKKGKTRGKMC